MNGMLELFKVGASLVLDKSGFDSDIREADAAGKGLSESLSKHMEKAKKVIKGLFSVGAVVAATKAIWNLAKETSAAGDRIDKQSQALGMSRKAFQEWDYILRQSGASIDDLGLTMKTMSAAITENSADTAAGLSKLGLSAAQLQNMSAEEQFETLVRAFQEMPEGVEKSQLAIQLFGRNAQSLMPLLNSATGSVDELRNRAHDLGLIMSDEDVDSAVAFGDALDDLNAVWTALKQKFGAQLLPGFTKGLITLANSLGRISNALTKAFKEGDWKGLFSTITEEISALLPQAIDAISGMILGLFENADKIIDLGISLVNGIVDGIAKAAPALIAKLPQILSKAWESIKSIGLKLGNVLIDAINGVLGTNIPHLDEIRWPTWPEVQLAFSNAWNAIQEKAGDLMKLIFGETEDGGIDWPEASEIWEKVKSGADTLWKGLQTLLGGIFKFIFGETEDGGIDWPEASEIWEKVKTGADILWNGLQTLLGGIFKFIFGETADGGIKWPTAAEIWLKIKSGLEKLWEGVQTFAKFVLKLVFGETADGGVKWPTPAELWLKIKDGLGKLWEGVQTFAKFVLKFVFGETADGGINWPDPATVWAKVSEKFTTFWNDVSAFMTEAATWVAGAFGLPPETQESIGKLVGGWWEPLRAAAEGAITWFLSDPETPGAYSAGVRIREAVRKWWERIKDTVGSVLKLIIGIPDNPSATQTAAKIKNWWDTEVVPKFKNLLNFVLGLFGLPSVNDMVQKIKTWWGDVKKAIADFLTIKLGIDFSWGGNGPDTSGYDNPQNQEVFESEGTQYAYDEWGNQIPLFAKGLNYVPYDGYRAILHRGETVLNQNQGREWRQNGGGAGIDFEALAAAVSGAVAEAVSNIQLNMDGKAVGSAVAGQVSREITRSMMGRRVPAL